MRLRDWPPLELADYARLVRARLQYRDCSIDSGRIGKDVRLGKGCAIYEGCEIGHSVAIGSYSYLSQRCIIGSGVVGSFCSIGYDCQIGMPEHPLERISTSPFTYGRRNIFDHPPSWEDFPVPPEIGNDVWIGSRAIVLQRVRIGHGAVVAAGAVVTQDVAPYTIVGGVPARILRKRFDDDVIRSLADWQWWDQVDREPQVVAAMFAADDWQELLPSHAAEQGKPCNT